MTRINVGIKPKQLTDSHLLAEHREIKRLCSMFKSFNRFDAIPKRFTLGTGHVTFFMDKGYYTFKRYCELREECLIRNFLVENYSDNWDVYDGLPQYYLDYNTTVQDAKLLIDRISERISVSKQVPRYYGKIITKEFAIELLTNKNTN